MSLGVRYFIIGVFMNFIRRFIGHFMTVAKHKFLVGKYCFRLGLYYQGIMHDMSKYSPIEFFTGVKYYTGNRSPNHGERLANNGYSYAWLHHKGRNKHHLEYWIDYNIEEGGKMEGLEMPAKYLAEMFCDRLAASKTYRGKSYDNSDPLTYFMLVREHYLINKRTVYELEKMLRILNDEGEDRAFEYIKNNILKKN